MATNAKKKYDKQETLQAIVFTDDFIDDLKPVEQVYPSTLLPIVTSPLLDYLLESLVRSRVQHVLLYCSSHLEQVKTYIESLRYLNDKDILITPMISDGCRSLGDALRDIDTKGCIRDDFILIRGTAFFNVDLKALMDLHRSRKEKDKTTVMTMMLRNLGNTKDSALKNESSLFVSNAVTRKVLHYQKSICKEKKVKLELQWFLEQDKVNIDTALCDTRIYLCSQSVLPLFADNFDFQTMDDFIHGVLMNEEFLNSRIYWEPVPYSSYSLPISSWPSYQMLCRDILQRQCYPLVPDTLPLSLRDYMYMCRSTYKHQTSTLSKGCILQNESVIGKNSTLGENSSIDKSIIGSGCTIGTNVKISNTHIISDVTIEDDCEIKDSIIFSHCHLAKGTKLNSCLVLPRVRCTKNYCNASIEIGSDSKNISKDLRQPSNDSHCNFASIFAFRDNCDDNDCDEDAMSVSSAWSSSSSLSSRDSPLPAVEDDNDVFLTEVVDSLLRGYEDKLKCENLILEINSSRYAYNISIQQVSYNVIKAILSLPTIYYTSKSKNSEVQSADYQNVLKTMLAFFKPIMVNYIKTDDAQEDCLQAIQDVTQTNQQFLLSYAQFILHFLYDNDILSEEKILDWYNRDLCDEDQTSDCDNSEDIMKGEEKQNNLKNLKKSLLPFIKWLEEAEEDSTDSD